MEEALTDPLDISKDSELIKEAQKDLSKVDVLVCGGCHEVFHFVEEFQKHKPECTNKSELKCENEEKSQIWGFTLWKTKQAKFHQATGETPSSWEIYQKWTKLDQLEKDLWISAGRTLQFAHKIANAKVREVGVKNEKKVDKDPLALDEAFTDLEKDINTNEIVKTGESKGTTMGVRTTDGSEKEEYTVEKIIGKRFNPRKRQWEYEVKWENYKEMTWEPLAHLENCKALVQEYEDKIKAEKANQPRGRGRPRVNPIGSPGQVKIVQKKPTPQPPTAVVITTPGGRPQRTSKQKALNQVKAWCGNISDGEEGGVKRPFDDDEESDDSFEKRMKIDGDTESDEEEPKTPVKRVAKIVHTYNNGVGKKLPDNVLIPDAKGVVRISQKQLPSLSSGVYIMSKSSGIIKLDPAASKIATSGGQAIVKVSPKIGQTQIRIIKKEDGSKKVVQVKSDTPTPPLTTITPPNKPKIIQQVVNKPPQIVRKEPEKVVKRIEKIETTPKTPITKIIVKEKEEPKKLFATEEESDDGIEELEFPTDLPLPEPDSPPGEFVLDPFTGKVAGQEYPDPEPAPIINESKKESSSSSTETIDNIVKLAAADITEEDLKPDEPITTPVTTAPPTVTTVAATPVTTVSTPQKETNVYAVVTQVKTGQSILNTAIVNSNILQKTLQSPVVTPKPKTQPRIINQAVAKPRTTMSPLVRPSPTQKPPLVRPKQPNILPKPKFNIAPMNPASVRNVYTKTNNVPKKVSHSPMHKTAHTKPAPSTVKPSPQKKVSTPIVPKPVISMPSLDEDPAPAVVLAPKAANQTPQAAAAVEADLSTFTLATGDRPMFITGDDGTVYQVAGQNEEGQTILLTQDSDGQQQCLLVTNEALQDVEQVEDQPTQVLMEVQEPVEMSEEQPLVAQFIRTEPPSPGGTHKVVVMLPDGDVMVTQVTPEEYASLELEK